jgi:hypothetical protein
MADQWRPPQPDGAGHMLVDGFNDYLSQNPELARSPIQATIEFARLRDPRALTTTVREEAPVLEQPQTVRVVLTEDGLPDDSIRAIRYVLDYERTGNRWRLETARRLQRCQPGRGHQRFSPAPCE